MPKVFELRYAEFGTEIDKGKTSHFHWTMSDFLKKCVDMTDKFVEHGGDDFCLNCVLSFFVDCKGGEDIAH